MTKENEGRKFHSIEVGTVIDNADPLQIGRVRVKIPGIAENPGTGWALPLGGGGKAKRGMISTPEVGADVAVFFRGGDPDAAYYIGGNYGAGEAPGPTGGYQGANDPANAITPETAHMVHSWEGRRYVIVCDERPGHERLFMRDKLTEDEIFLDGVKGGINIEATNINVKALSTVNIDGAAVNICGRAVRRNGKVIA